jgi:hypothetical protein
VRIEEVVNIGKLVAIYGKDQWDPVFVYFYDTESLGFASYIKVKLRAKKESIFVNPSHRFFLVRRLCSSDHLQVDTVGIDELIPRQ